MKFLIPILVVAVVFIITYKIALYIAQFYPTNSVVPGVAILVGFALLFIAYRVGKRL